MTNLVSEDNDWMGKLDSWIDSRFHVDRIATPHRILILIIAVVVTTTTVIHYLAAMFGWTNPGFSLDDSWIHLEYARSIFEGRAWEYSPGVPSTGSTSPLWSIVLSPLFLFTSNSLLLVLGVHLIAWILYTATSFLAGLVVLEHTNNLMVSALAIVGFVLVPGNTWLMLSGMEYPLFGFILIAGIWTAAQDGEAYDVVLGVLWGAAFLARPEGLVPLGLCVLARLLVRLVRSENKSRQLGLFAMKIPIALLIMLPWILHCLSVTGHPLPDTFYAKTGTPTAFEIEAWNSWWIYWLSVYFFLGIGAITGVYTLKNLRPYVWVVPLSLIVLYRLVIPYQALVNNARYLTPAFALLMLCAVIGLSGAVYAILKRLIPSATLHHTAVTFLIVGLLLAPTVGTYNHQAHFFGNAVKNINEMQVTIGIWINENTPSDAVLAISDVGAIRFFSERQVIDLLGLVTPDITHMNLTPSQTLEYLRDHGCEYLVLFEVWYTLWKPALGNAAHRLYTVNLTDNVICARPVMSVFWVNWSMVPLS